MDSARKVVPCFRDTPPSIQGSAVPTHCHQVGEDSALSCECFIGLPSQVTAGKATLVQLLFCLRGSAAGKGNAWLVPQPFLSFSHGHKDNLWPCHWKGGQQVSKMSWRVSLQGAGNQAWVVGVRAAGCPSSSWRLI